MFLDYNIDSKNLTLSASFNDNNIDVKMLSVSNSEKGIHQQFYMDSITKIKSKRERIGDGKSIWFAKVLYLSKVPNLGFAAARTEHLVFNVAMIPAFAILTVCCSRAS